MIKTKQLTALPVSHEAQIAPNIIRLAPRESISLKRQGQRVRVRSGKIWLTYLGVDFIGGKGKEFEVGHGRDKAIITAADKSPIQIEIID